jgi:hypothetical protein
MVTFYLRQCASHSLQIDSVIINPAYSSYDQFHRFICLNIYLLEDRSVKYLVKKSWLLLFCILLALTACGGGLATTPTVDTASIYTQLAATSFFMSTQTAKAASPTPAETATRSITNTPLLTDTPLPGTPSATVYSLATATSMLNQDSTCDNYKFVSENFPDGSEVFPDSPFTKNWRITNLGPCTWNQNYHIIFGWGGVDTTWNTVKPVPFAKVVVPGDSIELDVVLKAPKTSGSYAAAFRLQNDKGYNFGLSLTVVVKVK